MFTVGDIRISSTQPLSDAGNDRRERDMDRQFIEHGRLKHPPKRRAPNEDVNQAAAPLQEISQS